MLTNILISAQIIQLAALITVTVFNYTQLNEIKDEMSTLVDLVSTQTTTPFSESYNPSYRQTSEPLFEPLERASIEFRLESRE